MEIGENVCGCFHTLLIRKLVTNSDRNPAHLPPGLANRAMIDDRRIG